MELFTPEIEARLLENGRKNAAVCERHAGHDPDGS